MRCPECGNHLLQKSGKRTRLRVKGPLFFEDDKCQTQCFWCKAWVIVPVQLDGGILVQNEQFLLKR